MGNVVLVVLVGVNVGREPPRRGRALVWAPPLAGSKQDLR